MRDAWVLDRKRGRRYVRAHAAEVLREWPAELSRLKSILWALDCSLLLLHLDGSSPELNDHVATIYEEKAALLAYAQKLHEQEKAR